MTAIHAHLFFNHIPVVGLMFGIVFLIAGMKRSSVPTLLTGLHIFVVMGFIAIPVAISGLVSANVLQGAPWLDAGAVRTPAGGDSHARRSRRAGSPLWHRTMGIVTQG
jgi:hypothetical protein